MQRMRSRTPVGLVVRQKRFFSFFFNNGVFPRSSCFHYRLSPFSSFGFQSRMKMCKFSIEFGSHPGSSFNLFKKTFNPDIT